MPRPRKIDQEKSTTDFSKIEAIKSASQGNKEMVALLERVAKIEPKVILEIGVDKGYSMDVWSEAFNPDVLVGVDNNITALSTPAGKGLVIEGDSHDEETFAKVVSALEGKEIDFLFIDGDHHYDSVKLDYTNYGQLVRKGGIIAFHDATDIGIDGVEPYRFLAELGKEKDIEVIHIDGTGTAVVVRE
jgi:cephalosporin hydroxylase